MKAGEHGPMNFDTRTPKTWSEVKAEVEKIRNTYRKSYIAHNGNPRAITIETEILFRGQAEEGWPLVTSLERKMPQPPTFQRYMRDALKYQHEIESFTGKRWDISPWSQLRDELRGSGGRFMPNNEVYEYMVYLRHHGFPSPLLDWTESPFIASFFAYADAREGVNSALYCFIERPDGVKAGLENAPKCTVLGPNIRTHNRHFSQKASYTVVTQWLENEKEYRFCDHGTVMGQGGRDQDVLIKIILPADAKVEVLRELDDHNINFYTLYHDEENLIKTMGMRAFLTKRSEGFTVTQ
jgi:hypothetical protein